MSKPTRADILHAIELAEKGGWIDPDELPPWSTWSCEVFDERGRQYGDGDGHTAGEALGMAWLSICQPDALMDAFVDRDLVPLEVPDIWIFKLTPPGVEPEPDPAPVRLHGYAIGIDPGIRGGIAAVSDGLVGVLIDAIDIPVIGSGAAERVDVAAVRDFIRSHQPALALIERAQAMPRQGASSGFKYGRATGALEAAIVLCGVPLQIVEPSAWKRFWHLPGKDKEKARQRALELFPAAHALLARKKDHGRAEFRAPGAVRTAHFTRHRGTEEGAVMKTKAQRTTEGAMTVDLADLYERMWPGGDFDFETLAELRGDRAGPLDHACPLCGPGCRQKYNRTRKTLRTWEQEPGGFITYYCARCEAKGFVCANAGELEERPRILKPAPAPAPQDEAFKLRQVKRLWVEALPELPALTGYFRWRGIPLDAVPAGALRFHPACPLFGKRVPAILARYSDALTGELRGLWRRSADGLNKPTTLGPMSGCVISSVSEGRQKAGDRRGHRDRAHRGDAHQASRRFAAAGMGDRMRRQHAPLSSAR